MFLALPNKGNYCRLIGKISTIKRLIACDYLESLSIRFGTRVRQSLCGARAACNNFSPLGIIRRKISLQHISGCHTLHL